MTEEDMNQDPSVRLTRVAEQIQETAERQRRRDPWRDRVIYAVLALVLATVVLVGYSIYQQNRNDRSDLVTACRSELSAKTMVGLARGVAGLADASLSSEGDAFDRQLRVTADDLLDRANRYEQGARMSVEDQAAFIAECKKRG